MASTAAVTKLYEGDLGTLTKIVVTWDNSDLTMQDVVHQCPQGVRPILVKGLNTTAGTNTGDVTVAYDDANGEVTLTALQETGGSIANMVTEYYCFSFAVADQEAGSIPY